MLAMDRIITITDCSDFRNDESISLSVTNFGLE